MLGFEPRKALSYSVLSAARLTTPAHPHINSEDEGYKKLLKTELMIANNKLNYVNYDESR